MTRLIMLALIALAVSAIVMAQAGPAYAAQTVAGTNSTVFGADTVVGNQSPIPVQLVRGMHGGGGRMGFAHGRVGGFRAAHFNHFRHFRPFIYGSAVPYYSNYYYNDCVWDGYRWICDD
jgi:hypothetical protein